MSLTCIVQNVNGSLACDLACEPFGPLRIDQKRAAVEISTRAMQRARKMDLCHLSHMFGLN